MKKSPNQRTIDDVETIKSYLMTIPFLRDSFQDADQSFILLSKMFRLELFDSDQTIFHIGNILSCSKNNSNLYIFYIQQNCIFSKKMLCKMNFSNQIDTKGDKYYLILQGSVGIYIRPPKQVNKQIKQQRKKENNKEDQDNNKVKQNLDDLEDWEKQQNSHLRSLIMVKQLQEGQTFGEMALIYNKPRLATIHTLQDTVLAVLTKRDFRLIMKKAEMKQIKGELKFLKQVYFFNQWSYEMLRDIYLNSEQIQIQNGAPVFKEGDISDSIYIIKKGQFQVKI